MTRRRKRPMSPAMAAFRNAAALEGMRRNRVRSAWRKAQFAVDPHCVTCGVPMHNDHVVDDEQCTVDHYVSRAKGGADDETNWRLLCRGCNLAKADQ